MGISLDRVAVHVLVVFSLFGAHSSLFAQVVNEDQLIDAEQAFQVARQASEAGDFQTAIIALERVLVISPDLPNIQFELGLLYKRVGAARRAEYFFRESLKSEELPPEIRQRAEQELQDLASVEQAGDFIFNTGIGLQYESNPLLVSDRKEFFDIVSNSYVTGDSVEQTEGDGSLRASFGAAYNRRFGPDSRHSGRTGLSFKTLGYFDQTDLNSSDIRLDGSLAYSLNPAISSPRETISPYLYYNLGFDEDGIEDNEIGIGTSYNSTSELRSVRALVEASATRYDDKVRADSSDFNRVALGLNIGGRRSESSRVTYGLALNLAFANANEESESYTDANFRVSASYALKAIAAAPRAAAIFYAGSKLRRYSDFDLQISATEKRRDTSPLIGVSLSLPYSNGFSVSAGLQFAENQSNLANYRYNNTTASVGVNWRF